MHSTGITEPASRFWRAVRTLPLWGKLALAVASFIGYWVIPLLASALGLLDDSGDGTQWAKIIVGCSPAVLFAVLVMGPYAAASRLPMLRILAMSMVSAAIYVYAIKFVAQSPFGYSAIESYLISGGGSAVLTGLAVTMLAPRPFRWTLVGVTLVAGVIGGATFQLGTLWKHAAVDLLAVHFVWQILVCLALHAGLPPRGPNSLR